MAMTVPVIDVDSHLTEPADVWTSRVPHRYVDRVPQMKRNDEGIDIWVLDGQRISTVGMTAPAGWPTPFPSGPPTFEECPPASHDASARLSYLFGSQRFLRLADEHLKLLCVRAYNDFLRDWAAADSRRLLTIMAMPFWDVAASVAEIARGAAAGHRGILFTGEPQRFGLPHLGDKHWDPLWSAAQDADLPIHFHIGSGDMETSFKPDRVAATSTAAAYAYTSTELFLKNGLQVADLITSGVLVRFPTLKFVSVESGIGWIPFVLEAADHSYLEARPGHRSEWDMLPSDYFRRQVYACYWFETVAPTKLLGEIPEDNVLFETDFPHPTCLFGNIRERIDASLGNASAATREKILWGNAARLYGVEKPSNWAPAEQPLVKG
jgi:predicted TIM-barrel fold metal-dependent hydrolase